MGGVSRTRRYIQSPHTLQWAVEGFRLRHMLGIGSPVVSKVISCFKLSKLIIEAT